MIPKACLAGLAALVVAAPVEAAPVKLRCEMLGAVAKHYGPLAVVVDLEARTVEVVAAKAPGAVWRYRDGVTASPLAKGPKWLAAVYPPARQFVRVTPATVLFGWLDADGGPESGVLGSFNRSALDKPGASCHWHHSGPWASS